jgi:hypothetical protein
MVFYGTGGKLATYYHPLYGLGILPLILTSLLSVGLHSYLLPLRLEARCTLRNRMDG